MHGLSASKSFGIIATRPPPPNTSSSRPSWNRNWWYIGYKGSYGAPAISLHRSPMEFLYSSALLGWPNIYGTVAHSQVVQDYLRIRLLKMLQHFEQSYVNTLSPIVIIQRFVNITDCKPTYVPLSRGIYLHIVQMTRKLWHVDLRSTGHIFQQTESVDRIRWIMFNSWYGTREELRGWKQWHRRPQAALACW